MNDSIERKAHNDFVEGMRKLGEPINLVNNRDESLLEVKAGDGFKRALAIEILARFTGNSRGTPIAKKAFIDGALWAKSKSLSSEESQEEQSKLWEEVQKYYALNAVIRKGMKEIFFELSQKYNLSRKTKG